MSFGTTSSRSSGKRKRKNESLHQNRTLGMAWGANSSSSTSKNNRKNSNDGDFGRYMAEKERKLGVQFEADAANVLLNGDSANCAKGLFSGVSIFVDGFTTPSNQELRNYMIKHGGRFENYFSRERVTHIICSNLPETKLKNLRSFSRGLPVVKPQWIVDSVAANKILPLGSYYLEQRPHQQRLSSFFTIKSNPSIDEDFVTEIKLMSTSGCEESSLNGGVCEREEDCDQKPDAEILRGELNATSNAQETHGGHGKNYDEENSRTLHGMTKFHTTDLWGACGENGISTCNVGKPADTEDCNLPVEMPSKETMLSRSSTAKHTLHSTLGDANFVENYFKNSRLHFIGTWRNRYRKRFASRSDKETHCKYSGLDVATNGTHVSESHVFIHIDMDCFFVSVVIRNHPELDGKPVAVCHSGNPHGTAEISSANYPARGYGISAGMFVRDAKALCPNLVIVPYDFGAYEEVADHFYDILHKHCDKVQAVSCDEAYLQVTTLGDPDHIASTIRKEIFDVTKCTASAGISGNLLMARMATKRAKPNGQYHIQPEQVDQFLAALPISELPGVGHALQEKLNNQNIHNCSELRLISKEALQRYFGSKIGDMLWHYSRGIDNRQVQPTQEHKSIGAEVNWGVRFNEHKDVHHFLMNLSKEVSLRLQGACMQGRTITLKVKKRKKGAGEPAKFMGCGSCDNVSHSVTVASATNNMDILLRVSRQLFASFHLDVREVRGIGLHVSKLESVNSAQQGHEENVLRSWLASTSAVTRSPKLVLTSSKGKCVADDGHERVEIDGKSNLGKGVERSLSAQKYDAKYKREEKIYEGEPCLPHISQLDQAVLASLPPEILAEINDMYGGKVLDHTTGKPKISDGDDMQNTHITDMLSTDACNEEQLLGILVLEGSSIQQEGSTSKNRVCDSSWRHEIKGQEDRGRDASAPLICSVDPPVLSELDHAVLLDLPLSLGLEIEQEYENAVALRKHNIPVSGEKTFKQSHLPLLKLEKDNERVLVEEGRTSSSHSGFMNVSVGNNGRQESRDDSMPISMSQVDITVLQELPTGVQRDILDSLPAHRPLKTSKEIASPCRGEDPSDVLGVKGMEPEITGVESKMLSEKSLWKGDPPLWVEKFKCSNCIFLYLLSECYNNARPAQKLSSIMLYLVSSLPQEFVSRTDWEEQAVVSCSELFKQYIEEKIECDIEEIFICFRLLKRLVGKSNFWFTVYNMIFPVLQARMEESYGGHLKL